MLACLAPLRVKADENHTPCGKGKPESPSRHGGKHFVFQLKQIAVRLTGGSLSRYCRPGCASSSRQSQSYDNTAVHPSCEEMHSPQFSLKSYQMNGSTPNRQDVSISSISATSDSRFTPRQYSPRAVRSLQRNFDDVSGDREGDGSAVEIESPRSKSVSHKWVAQVEPGVFITFCTAPDGYNNLKRIKFSRAIFSKQHAEKWWTENCPKIRTLYNVRPPSSCTTDDDRLSSGYATPDTCSKSPCLSGRDFQLARRKSSADSRVREDSTGYESRSGEIPSSWVERDDVGVYLTIFYAPDVGKQLKRVRFSRDRFSEAEAAAWWEHNRQRIYTQYIFTKKKSHMK